MTSGPPPQCLSCSRWRSPLDTELEAQTCDAYPDGIPDQIWTNAADHRQPFNGDHGVRWLATPGETFPEWALAKRPAARIAPLFNVDVSEIDLSHVQDEWMRALDSLLTHWVGITESQREQIADQVRAAVNRDDIRALVKMSVSVSDAVLVLTAAMNDMAIVAAQQVVDDAAAEGVNIEPHTGDQRDREEVAALLAYLIASGLTNAAAREALRRTGPGARGDDVAQSVDQHLAELSDAYLRDILGGALTAAQNQARFATMAAGPEVALYASEQMDKGTCKPCRQVNGRWLGNSSDMSQVHEVYPNGGYVECLGGTRCRGTVVAVYRPERVTP